MKNMMLIVLILLAPSLAVADPLKVSRVEADTYTATNGTLIKTQGCNVSADRMTARIDHDRGRTFVVFYDQNGEDEGECQIAKVSKRPATRTRVAKR